MIAATDLIGWAAVLSVIFGGANAILNTLIHRKATSTQADVRQVDSKAEAVKESVGRVEAKVDAGINAASVISSQLAEHYARVEGAYQTFVEQGKALITALGRPE